MQVGAGMVETYRTCVAGLATVRWESSNEVINSEMYKSPSVAVDTNAHDIIFEKQLLFLD